MGMKSASFLVLIVFVIAVISATTTQQRQAWEKASNGACHARKSKKMCFLLLQYPNLVRNLLKHSKLCKKWEDAAHGACHTRGGKKMCFCYFGRNC
ncbi:hypothetical protein MKW92_009536 [Papaver armeniacum]|nr:hypothetical protein MKW92_009536 [Papaver armeniacum]